jgi:Ni,Fe-hydrogenase maturation factor
MRVLVGIVGYRYLRDFSAPFAILDQLEATPPGPDVLIEDVSYNPIAVVQWLESKPPEARFDRVIFVAAAERGRPAGTVTTWRWDGVLPSDADVQQAVAEAVTGIISLENTLMITGYFKALPPEVVVVETEPLDHAFGAEMSRGVQAAIEPASTRILELARRGDALEQLPPLPLPARAYQRTGGGW